MSELSEDDGPAAPRVALAAQGHLQNHDRLAWHLYLHHVQGHLLKMVTVPRLEKAQLRTPP